VVERYILATLENATTIAALSAAHARGKDNRNFADELAVNALRSILNGELPVAAEVVIGEGERDEAPMLYIGEKLGPDPESEPLLQIAVDPLEGTNLCARGEAGAISVIAAVLSHEGRLMPGIDGYMNKLVLGNKLALGRNLAERLSTFQNREVGQYQRPRDNPGLLDHPIEEIVEWIAGEQNKPVADIVAMVLERPRNEELIRRLRALNVQIKLIRDGDITAGLLALDPNHDVDLAVGIGAAAEAVITAAMTQVYGGYMEAQWWIPPDRAGVEQQRRLEHLGIDIDRRLYTDDLAGGQVMFALTAITANDFIPGVRYEPGGVAITHTISGRRRTGTINRKEARHPKPPLPPEHWPMPQ
jgi:fructose-1,6-bisphosphatase/sedoheptulose 1,7-bisphosphatase-like protein